MKVAILGFGIEGESAYKYLRKVYSECDIEIFDEKKQTEVDGVKIIKVTSFLDIDFSSFSVIVRSPSIPPIVLKEKIMQDKSGNEDFVLTSATKIFFENCPAKIIGVTGTKGKGTVSSFITEILKANDTKTHLVGNIGVSALDILPEVKSDDAIVYELSSFQLWDLDKSPHIAVVTLLEPDHLEVHRDYQEYIEAKLNIVSHQNADDYFIYNSELFDNELFFGTAKKVNTKTVDASSKKITLDTKELIEKNVKLPGLHNLQNASLAVCAVRAFDNDITDEVIVKGLSGFAGLPHRLKFVAEKNSVKYYDDSIATTPGSAIAAIKSFEAPKILILGGHDKGADYSVITGPANEYGVKEIFAIGANREKVAKQVGDKFKGKITLLDEQNIDDIVRIISKVAEDGDVVIMSPAAASFDMFPNYKVRGEMFVDAVNKLP